MRDEKATRAIELWGGVECTINRVQSTYFNQLQRTGHAVRSQDLEAFAGLGIKKIRYPILWEQVAPDGPAMARWKWADERLSRLRALRLTPIVGLLHHGSGPRHTNLMDPAFPELFVAYAKTVAARYPWVEWFTPINEPLTTARFSGLYGTWFPHASDPRQFWIAVRNQMKAIVMSMAAIRRFSPHAKLLQTEDLGETYATGVLGYQAEFQNALRWLTWDLLCGRVDRHHPTWDWLWRVCNAKEQDFRWFADNPCVPDVVGVNHYITSDRLLVDDLSAFPQKLHGGNGRHRYVDVEAVRCLSPPPAGLNVLLQKVFERYALPVALTEVHIDAPRDDQLRWLMECWHAANDAASAGVNVRGFTPWSLLGSFDWNSLVTESRGYYESGAFDVRAKVPRPTAVARAIRQIASGQVADHPVLSTHGWWCRDGRLSHSVVVRDQTNSRYPRSGMLSNDTAPLLITGASGTLGSAFARVCEKRGLRHHVLPRQHLDISDEDAIRAVLAHFRPWGVINAAGFVRVDDAELEIERCYRENTLGPRLLARSCAAANVSLLTFSSDLVFDGDRDLPYVEDDSPAPLNIYGWSKAKSESAVLHAHEGALVVRTSAFFGPWDSFNHVALALRALRTGEPFAAAHDLTVSPTYVPDLVRTSLDLLIDGESGIWHLTNGEPVSWWELTVRAAAHGRIDAGRLEAVHSKDLGLRARRPRYSALSSTRPGMLPSLDDALARYHRDTSVR